MPVGNYKRTREQYKKICTPERNQKISDTLKMKYRLGIKKCWDQGKKLSKEHKKKISIGAAKGQDNHSWKGEDAGYTAIHIWLRKYYGKASKCENRERKVLNFRCSGTNFEYEWSKRKERRYSRKREDYFQLCKSCHSKYDSNPKKRFCSIPGCGLKHRRNGYCDKHAQRLKKWANPLAIKVHGNPIEYKI